MGGGALSQGAGCPAHSHRPPGTKREGWGPVCKEGAARTNPAHAPDTPRWQSPEILAVRGGCLKKSCLSLVTSPRRRGAGWEVERWGCMEKRPADPNGTPPHRASPREMHCAQQAPPGGAPWEARGGHPPRVGSRVVSHALRDLAPFMRGVVRGALAGPVRCRARTRRVATYGEIGTDRGPRDRHGCSCVGRAREGAYASRLWGPCRDTHGSTRPPATGSVVRVD